MDGHDQPAEEAVRRWLTERFAALLACGSDEIDPDAPLTELGLDSVTMVGVCTDLEAYVGVPVDAELVWDNPTIAALSRAVLDR